MTNDNKEQKPEPARVPVYVANIQQMRQQAGQGWAAFQALKDEQARLQQRQQ